VNVVDSSGWLEYLANGPNAEFFAPALEDVERLVVPTICIVEVGKIVRRQRDEQASLEIMALMEQHRVVEIMALMEQHRVVALDTELARNAVGLGITHRLPLADSIILATARAFQAEVWTQDEHFDGIPGCHYIPKVRSAEP
jgi:toxin FitB